jgi:hypothetical protein
MHLHLRFFFAKLPEKLPAAATVITRPAHLGYIIDRLVIPNVNKNDVNQGAGLLAKYDVSWMETNSTSVPPIQKSKQS